MLGGTEAELDQHLTNKGGRGVSCPGEVNAELYLLWVTGLSGPGFPCLQYSEPQLQVSGETSELLLSPQTYSPPPTAPTGQQNRRGWAGVLLTSHAPGPYFSSGVCLESAALRQTCATSIHSGTRGQQGVLGRRRGEAHIPTLPSKPWGAQGTAWNGRQSPVDSGLSTGPY